MAYPTDLTSQLKAGDRVLKYIPLKYGWVALTEERVLYNARVYYADEKKSQVETANLPISKISSMSVKQNTVKTCIFKKRFAVLKINMQGAVYDIELGKDGSAAQPLIAEFNARSG